LTVAAVATPALAFVQGLSHLRAARRQQALSGCSEEWPARLHALCSQRGLPSIYSC
jgi:hypothetical protein